MLRVSALALMSALTVATSAQADMPIKADLAPMIERVLRDKPELLMGAIKALQARAASKASADAGEAIAKHGDALLKAAGSPTLGNPTGDVIVVMFSDYRCGYCRRSHPDLADVVARDGNVRVVMKELPILGPVSVLAAKAALAAAGQGRYQSFHDALMTATEPLTEASILAIATRQGLDVAELQRAMSSPAIQAELDQNQRLAAGLGITGTPAFVIGDKLLRGAAPADTLRTAILSARRQMAREDRVAGSSAAPAADRDVASRSDRDAKVLGSVEPKTEIARP